MKKLLILLTLGLMFGQTEWTTKVYTINDIYYDDEFLISDYSGTEFEYYILRIIDVTPYPTGLTDYCLIEETNSSTRTVGIFVNPYGTSPSSNSVMESVMMSNSVRYRGINNATLTFAITAEFPIEDTGYMEEDFDFCINEGLNLVSYPCENDIAINDALPSEISNNLSSIVGEGVAGVNVNGTWVGSLTQLQAGSGYWFKSSIEACFNYECAEN